MEPAMTVKVSIIVPVYNVEQYLEECIRSCVNQTWRNLQIVLIDDGSSDSSASICNQWAEKDERIIVIHCKNGGVSRARNKGIEIADGDLICFVDGDDTADSQMIECAIKEMKQDVDLVVWGYQTVDSDKDTLDRKLPENAVIYFETDRERAEYISRTFLSPDHTWAVWNKMFRKEKIDTYLPPFPEHIQIAEDLCFNFHYLLNSQKIVTISKALYSYRIRSDSAMGKAKLRMDYNRVLHLASSMRDYLKRTNCAAEEKLFPVYMYRLLENEHERVSDFPLTDYPELREELGKDSMELAFFREQFEKPSHLFPELKELYGKVKALRVINYVEYICNGNRLKYHLYRMIIKWYSRLLFWLNPWNLIHRTD